MSEYIVAGADGRGRGWEASIDFDASEAIIQERRKESRGVIGPIAVVPLDSIIEADEEDASLDPNAEGTRTLLLILAAPRMLRVLKAAVPFLEMHEDDAGAVSDLIAEIKETVAKATDTGNL